MTRVPSVYTVARIRDDRTPTPAADWRDAGKCVTWTAWPWDPWYPVEDATSTDPVKLEAAWADGRALCDRCPIEKTCLEDNLAHESGATYYRHGMRGGKTPLERARIAEARRRKAQRARKAETT